MALELDIALYTCTNEIYRCMYMYIIYLTNVYSFFGFFPILQTWNFVDVTKVFALLSYPSTFISWHSKIAINHPWNVSLGYSYLVDAMKKEINCPLGSDPAPSPAQIT